jgi:hypothetical protein
MIKAIAPYQLLGYKTLEIVVDSKSSTSFYFNDPYPINILENSNPVPTEEIIHSRAEDVEDDHMDIVDDDIYDDAV